MILSLLLGGCSTVGIAYNQAPTLLYYWLDDFVDFDSGQATDVKAALKSLHQWHRAEELPKIAHALADLQTLASGRVSAEQVCGQYQRTMELVQETLYHPVPDIARIGRRFSPDQLQGLQKALQKRNQRWQDEWVKLDPTELLDKRTDQWVNRLESLYGSLSKANQALVRQSLSQSGWDIDIQTREFLRRQQDMVQVLTKLQERKLSASEAEQEVRQWITRNQKSPDANYRAYSQRLTSGLCTLLADFHNQASPEQRKKALKTLRDYELEARAL